MSITLVTHKLDNDTGGARYANELRQRIHYDQIIHIKNKSNSAIDFFITIPLKVLLSEKTDIYHIAFNPCGLAAIPIKLFGKKLIFTIHDINPILENPLHLIRIPNQIAIWLADKIITDAEMVKQDVIKIFKTKKHIDVIPLGISERFRPISQKRETFKVGYIGAFKRHKNVEFLIKGFKGIDGMLELYGTGDTWLDCMQLCQDKKISNVWFMGRIPEERIVEAYNSFSVFVFPSIYEGFGFPILEAMRCGVPVIVKADSHIPEEVTRYCFKVKTQEELNMVLRRFKDEGYTGSEEAVEYARSFDWKRCAEATERILNDTNEV